MCEGNLSDEQKKIIINYLRNNQYANKYELLSVLRSELGYNDENSEQILPYIEKFILERSSFTRTMF
jgi:hypothetical protein